MAKSINVYDEYNKLIFSYTNEMKPEAVRSADGGFDIYYLSGFEKEDKTDMTCCHYPFDYSYIMSEANECKYCTGSCDDLLQMKTSLGAMGEIHNTVWVSTDDLDDDDVSELKMDFSLVADSDEVYGDVQKLRIHFCPMCGRKLK